MRYTKQQSGFTLVETLVSLTILLLVIIGPMTISSSTAKSTTYASEQVLAFFLAQEGSELAQKARDDLLLSNGLFGSSAWSDFTDTSASGDMFPCFNASGCGLEINTDLVGSLSTTNCSTVTNCRINVDLSPGVSRSRYTYSTGASITASPFTRVIKLTPVSSNQVQVVSEVTWRTGNQITEQSVQVETYLFDVYGN